MLAVVPFAMPEADAQRGAGASSAWTRLNAEQMTADGGRPAVRGACERGRIPAFFTLIHLPLIAGDPSTVFRQPESIVLSQSAARKYFGDADPIGRTLVTGKGNCDAADTACQGDMITLKVTGVMADLLHNTHLTRVMPSFPTPRPPITISRTCST